MDLSFILNELGEERDRYSGAVSPPVYQSSNFCFPDIHSMREALKKELDVPFYTRGNNPTVAILRKKVAALEGMDDALIFGSGSAAMATAVINSVQHGDHVVSVENPYSWTNKLLSKLLPRFGVKASFIDGRDPENWEKAIQNNTKLFVLESPNSISFELQDLAAVSSSAKKSGIRTVLDNSYASPLNQRSSDFGIDIVIHSASKYLNGHSDVVAGVLCSSRPVIESIFESEYMTLGGIISPHDAWLMIRGLRTLEIRMQRVADTTAKVLSYIEKHPKVKSFSYPMHSSHPQYELAKKQLRRGTGQFSLYLNAKSIPEVERFCNALNRFLMACSWGGHESLIFPICALYDSANYNLSPHPWNLVRFYIGLEDPDVLIGDLEQAFTAMD